MTKANASDDEAVDTPRVEQTPLTPAAAKEIKEKKGKTSGNSLSR